MPEGDTIHYAAKRVRVALIDRDITAVETHQRFSRDRWSERLDGQRAELVRAHGKHLFIHFASGLTLHSHLRMSGSWGVHEKGRRWGRSPRRAWLILRTADHDVVQFDGPVLELMTEGRARFDQRLAALAPDILAPELDETGFLRRLREDDPTRGIADALLDQRTLAGIGNLWKCEGCFMAGVDPWRPLREVSNQEALRIVHVTRPLMQRSAETGVQASYKPERTKRGQKSAWVYGRTGMPCLRCGTRIRSRGQGDDNRPTFWCPGCQR